MKFDMGLEEASVKLNGAILRKAEFQKNFEETYLKIFEKIAVIEFFGIDAALEILGEVAG